MMKRSTHVIRRVALDARTGLKGSFAAWEAKSLQGRSHADAAAPADRIQPRALSSFFHGIRQSDHDSAHHRDYRTKIHAGGRC